MVSNTFLCTRGKIDCNNDGVSGHIFFFCKCLTIMCWSRIKGIAESRCRHVVRKMIEALDLEDIAGRDASLYSGGQKRRLSLGE